MPGAELTDPRSARVRALRQLTRRRHRSERRQFLVEGANAVGEGLGAHLDGRAHVRELVATATAIEREPELVSRAVAGDIAVTVASPSVLAALSDTVTPQGLVAVVDYLDATLDAVLSRGPTLIAVLADVRDPGNAGSAIRVADAAGADAVVLAGDSVDLYNGKVVRASVGGLFHLPIVTGVPAAHGVDRARQAGMRVLVADASGPADLDSSAVLAQLSHPTAWIFGNEAWGVPTEVSELADAAVRVPIYGDAESLNLATAVALCLYASARAQRSSPASQVHTAPAVQT